MGYPSRERERCRLAWIPVGVSGNATQDTGIFVLHRALDDAAAEGAIVGGGRDRRLQGGRGIERRARHAEWPEDFALAKRGEGFVR